MYKDNEENYNNNYEQKINKLIWQGVLQEMALD